MPTSEFPLSLVIKAVDKATGPLKKINERIEHLTAPLHNSFKALKEELGEEKPIGRLVEGFKKVGEATGELGKGLLETGKRFLEMGILGGVALYEIVKSSIEAGTKLKEMSDRTGLGVDQFARLQFAAGQAHVKQDEFNDAMDQFNKRLGEMKAGGGPLLEFLNKVSPKLAQQVKGAKNTGDALGIMTRAFTKLNDPQKIAALTAEAFGKSSKALGMFLHQGSEEIEKQAKTWDDLAGSQEDFADQSEEAEKALNLTGAAFTGLRNSAMTPLLPIVADLAKSLAGLISGKRGEIAKWATEAGTALKSWVKDGGLERLITGLGNFLSAAGSVAAFLGNHFKLTMTAIGLFMAGPLISAIIGLIPALFSLGVALAPFVIAAAPFIAAAIGVGAAAYEIYKNWGDIKFFFKDLWGSVVFYAKEAWDKLSPVVDAVVNAAKLIAAPLVWGANKSRHLFGLDSDTSRPTLGADRAAAAGGGQQSTQTRVVVDFNNVPKGTRVKQDGDAQPELNMSYGPAMVGG